MRPEKRVYDSEKVASELSTVDRILQKAHHKPESDEAALNDILIEQSGGVDAENESGAAERMQSRIAGLLEDSDASPATLQQRIRQEFFRSNDHNASPAELDEGRQKALLTASHMDPTGGAASSSGSSGVERRYEEELRTLEGRSGQKYYDPMGGAPIAVNGAYYPPYPHDYFDENVLPPMP
eukprot:g19843.t1